MKKGRGDREEGIFSINMRRDDRERGVSTGGKGDVREMEEGFAAGGRGGRREKEEDICVILPLKLL